ncbi:hypothetical protein RRG08_011228 [Elysia crispata]|uniref:Uncharacterized protein n=1 Tax=Elysia crispata TaxID=231223 RepID=A0AAE1D2L3_9GAST|nr:hypothetical protein RRG08_011228 [Elysia crispata]
MSTERCSYTRLFRKMHAKHSAGPAISSRSEMFGCAVIPQAPPFTCPNVIYIHPRPFSDALSMFVTFTFVCSPANFFKF